MGKRDEAIRTGGDCVPGFRFLFRRFSSLAIRGRARSIVLGFALNGPLNAFALLGTIATLIIDLRAATFARRVARFTAQCWGSADCGCEGSAGRQGRCD